MAFCQWCKESKPVWSYHAKVWIHRRERLDRRCLNPPNDYGYTTQVPDLTISDEIRMGLRLEPSADEFQATADREVCLCCLATRWEHSPEQWAYCQSKFREVQ
jgi:hypothetical protein